MTDSSTDIAQNRKARFEYEILETFEAGLVLKGTEVKSLRARTTNISDAFVTIRDGEAFVHQMSISPYEMGNRFNHDPLRPRKLLMHRAEINKLVGKVKEKGYTLVPLKIYFSRGKAKVDLALATGKKLFDKRHNLAEKDAKREVERVLKDRRQD